MRLIFTLITTVFAASAFAINYGTPGKSVVSSLKKSETSISKGYSEENLFNAYPNNLSAVKKNTNDSLIGKSRTATAKIKPSIFVKTASNNNPYSIGKTYMWKSAFESAVNDTLLSQLNNYGIDTLLLSPGNNAIKITDFLTKSQNQNIHVSRLLSENSYASDSIGVQKLIAKLQTLQYDFPGLHLNIEPHTFDDYKANIPFYTARMDSLYDVAKQWCDPRNMKLTVSVPMHLPIQNATFLATNDITAYIMAYENPDQQKLLTRTQLLRATLGNNYVWVLRISDFATQQDLLDAITYLNANGVSRVALYDFSTISNLF